MAVEAVAGAAEPEVITKGKKEEAGAEGEKKAEEISMAYECGMYQGTIKATITHLTELING